MRYSLSEKMRFLVLIGLVSAEHLRKSVTTPTTTAAPPIGTGTEKIKRDSDLVPQYQVLGLNQALPLNIPQSNFDHFYQAGYDGKDQRISLKGQADQTRFVGFPSPGQGSNSLSDVSDFGEQSIEGVQRGQQYAANGGYFYAPSFNQEEFNAGSSEFSGNGNGSLTNSGINGNSNRVEFTSSSTSGSFSGSPGNNPGLTEAITPLQPCGGCTSTSPNSNTGYPSYNGCLGSSSSSSIGCGYQPSYQTYPSYPPSYQPSYQPPKVITKEIRVPVPQPYPVTVVKKVPVPVPQPYPVQVPKPVPYRVEVRVPVPVPKPYPVTVTQKVPVKVPVYVKVLQPVRVPYPVQVKVPVYIRVPVPVLTGGSDNFHEHHGSYQNYQEYQPVPAPSYGVPAPVYGPPGYQPGGPQRK